MQKWLLLVDAAKTLDISRDALRARIRRKTVEAEKRDDRWYVLVAVPDDEQYERTHSVPPDKTDELIYLRSVLDKQMEAIERGDEAERELRVLIAQQAAQLVDLSKQLQLTSGNTVTRTESASGSHQSTGNVEPDQSVVEEETNKSEPTTRSWWRFWES